MTSSPQPRWRAVAKTLAHPVLLASAIVTGLVTAGWQLGRFQYLELITLDQMVRWQGDRGPDPRLLVVTITENDLTRYSFPVSDQVLAQALEKLQQHQPRVIGLDIFRNLPKEPGHAELLSQLAQSNVIGITRLSTEKDPTIAPPPKIPPERVGFNDVVTDPDGVLRRNWIYGDTETSQHYSLALRLAQVYLAKQGSLPQADWRSYGAIPWGKAVLTPLQSNSGGYQNIDAAGYQLLLNYRSPDRVAGQITLTQLLKGQVEGHRIRDKIVLIGTTAPSVRDVFFTPYSAAEKDTPKMPGVLIHAQMVSQLLDAAMGSQSLIRFWPEGVEALWILSWSLVGGVLAWWMRHPIRLALVDGIALTGLTGISFGLLVSGLWVPLVTPTVTLILTSGSVLAYTAYQAQKMHRSIALQAREQEKTIALLRTLLTESTHPITEMTRPNPNDLTATIMTGGLEPSAEETAPLLVPGPSTQTVERDRIQSLLGGRYRIVRVLGSGGFSLTYLAEDTQRPGNPICVVKHLLPARSDAKFLYTARRLFRTEAEILEKLGGHPQIPQLFASFEENGRFYLVQEFIEGPSLSDELGEGHILTEPQVLSLLRDVLEVLLFVHSYQVIHRDIKPSNIIRRKKDNRLVLIDFGAVKQMQPPLYADREGPTVAIGTRGYAPAEQLAGHPGLNSDIYALGMIAIQALTGVQPQQLQQDQETGTVLWSHLTQATPGLVTLLERMVRYYFNERYQSASEVMQDLKHLTGE
ncbi:CHASE2 domain-containing serine/threonine-protein kinase [Leptolyngbya sp. 'hensonii']|uniref:CHASE2 domain-containing serine/threonine-protein kinase n=1 Tax=Leptolyngbya sp. 'hensonii' TaxID=1922337 RepID=UPI0009F845E2|nr:CHASE2 domain-containing serine/threonine-protein kinase [Leptolyngbya sp. 'hensonii']